MNSTLNPALQSTLEALTPEQKWQAFQFLWQEVEEGHSEEIEPPHWHDEILKERAQKIEDGRAEWLDFDQAMEELEGDLVASDSVRICAVLDCRRDLSKIQSLLRKR